jgi:hypothetical protein
MKLTVLLFALFCLLVGCAGPAMRVRVSDGRSDYSVYRNGVEVCTQTDSCEFSTPISDESFYLQVRRNGVIYGGTRIYREGGAQLSDRSVENWMRSTRPTNAYEVTTNVLTLPIFDLKPSKIPGQFPDEVVLTIGPKDSLQANYPWDKPMK